MRSKTVLLCATFFLVLTFLVAHAERSKLKTGEWLSNSEYIVMTSISGEKTLGLSVTFEEKADKELREESLQELVVQYLLPTALRDNFDSAQLFEERKGLSIGIFNAKISENWDFKKNTDTQWVQTGGPEIDWSIIGQELVPDANTSLQIPSKFIKKSYPNGRYNLYINSVADWDLSPKDAMLKAVDALINGTACNLSADTQVASLQDPNLNAIYSYVRPKKRADLLDIVPAVHYGLGRVDGQWKCDRQSMRLEVERLDWSERKAWGDIIR